MAGEKYKMFKQFMHNELGITKEDIREWVKESVREEAAKMIAKTYEDFDVKREIRDLINSPYNSIRKDLLNACAAEIIKDFKLVYKPSSENQSMEDLIKKVESLQKTVELMRSNDIILGTNSCI
jgi:predicted transcriptional regulator